MKGNDEIRQVTRVADLTDGGMTYKDLRQRLRSGDMTRIRHGAVVTGRIAPDRRGRHLELLAGTLPVLRGDQWVLSHTTAAAVLGLPMMRDGSESIWVTRPPGTGGHRRPQLITRGCGIEPDEIVMVDGMRVTSPERTAIDMAREFGFVTGVTIADAVLALGGSQNRLDQELDRARRRRGNATARRVVSFADGIVESPGESLMRAMLKEKMCAPTSLQVKIYDPYGRFVARSDFGWLEWGVVGEYDGPQKYLRDRKPGESLSDVVIREKAREADIRDQSLEVIRFCAADLRDPEAAAARVRRLLNQRGLLPTPWTNPVPQAPQDDYPWGPPWDL